ncbi:MAG: histidine kinase dimerization/phosphoacceptor domain -containing protein [Bacteroidota bacterium]
MRKNTMQRLLIFIVFASPLVALAQSSTNDNELYNLHPSETLTDLPLDTAFVKVRAAINDMKGETDAQIKADLGTILARSRQSNNPEYMAKAYGQLALWHYLSIHSETPDSIHLHDSLALTYWLQTTDTASIAKAYATLGLDLFDMQRYEEAENQCMKGLALAKAIDDQDRITSIHSYLAIIYSSTQDYERALQYTEEVIAFYEANDKTHPLIRALVSLSDIQVQTGKAEAAVASANRALALIEKLPEDYQASESYNIRVWRGKAYRALGKYDEALEDMLFGWRGMASIYGEEMVNGWKGDIGSIYYLKGDYQSAIPYLRDYHYHVVARKNNVPKEFLEQTNQLAFCFQAMEQLDSSLFYIQKARDFEVSLLEEELAAVKNELRIKYDTEQKEQTIVTQSSKLQQQKRIQQLSFGIGGLLTLLLGGLFLTYRNNQKKNIRLQELNDDLEDTNLQLDQRNAQNELLLKEIHHRVKNNLETVSSLLELQSAQVDDDEIQSVMQASQSRVQSMSILHQKLYQGDDLSSIEMKDYFKNLAESVLDTYDAWEQVDIEYDMSALDLDIDTAIPIGLIVNELLTNSLKYAFSDGEQGKINLSLRQKGSDLSLIVADNGIGYLDGEAIQGTGFGSQLVNLLTRQLNGEMEIQNKEGTKYIFEFLAK